MHALILFFRQQSIVHTHTHTSFDNDPYHKFDIVTISIGLLGSCNDGKCDAYEDLGYPHLITPNKPYELKANNARTQTHRGWMQLLRLASWRFLVSFPVLFLSLSCFHCDDFVVVFTQL